MLRNDVRYALRLMRRNLGFTAVAVGSLALGIGANTAIFSLFYTIVLRQLPVAHPEQLVELTRWNADGTRNDGYWGWEKYALFRDRSQSFSAITGTGFDNLAEVRTEGGAPEQLILENVPGNYFAVLGVKPVLGRAIGPEDVPGRGDGDVVVVSWSYWKTRLDGDGAVLGKRIWYGDAAKTIIGVAPREYVGPRVGSRTDVWMPAEGNDLSVLARLRPGVTAQQAAAELTALYSGWLGKSAVVEAELAGAGMTRVRDRYGKPLVLLLSVVGALLLLACINTASLLLARSAGRKKEMAVRVGLGASRGQLVRQMLTESLLLSGAGTLGGVAAAYWGTGVLVRIMASSRAFEHIEIEVHPDVMLMLFAAGIAVLTGLLFGLAPAWHALRQTGDTGFWQLVGKGLVTAQVALSILLVTAAVTFLGHLTRLRNFDLGFRSDHVLMVRLDPTHSGYKREQLAGPYHELLKRMETIPQVRSASIGGCAPLEGCGSGSRYLIAEGYVERPEERRRTSVTFVAPRYFATLGIPLVAGRDFTMEDAGRARVAVVNQTMARRYFPGVTAVGKRVLVDRNPATGGWFGSDQPYEIVGVVGDAKAVELREAAYPTIYFDMFQEGRIANQFALRTQGSPEALAGTVRQMVRESLNTVPVTRVTTMEALVDSNIVPERLVATLSEFFGCLGALLAGIGLYGLMAYSVTRRTHEIGIRMALGATARSVRGLVLGDVVAMVAAGLASGLVLVLWSRPLAASVLRDLKTESVAPVAMGGAVMVVVALIAAYVPVRRAVRVDPLVALRHE